ncbi:hypothetical protein [Corynebacterium endometrii]|uniref:Uncharacterized protein n=1 Tax=Corynebacterium endometrii TaxID=2488819 RepID=A0A4P7QHZ8_9CORY|nr:hypothetical protein [Corynebacterium endometrii]QCB29342.1 hypothetical protein CENDO_10440 [Corynebacterium endometrii]
MRSKGPNKLVAASAAGFLAVSTLAACGDSGSSEPVETTVTETVTETSVVESTVTETETVSDADVSTSADDDFPDDDVDESSSSDSIEDVWDPVRDGGSAADPYA